MGSSIQSSGFESVGSSMTFSGLTGGLKSVLERSEAVLTCLLSTSSLTLLSVPTMAVYRWVSPSPTSGEGGPTRCFSSHSPETGFRWRRMKCTLFVEPQLSGPNMMVYGVSALKPSCERSSEAESSLMYAPPHCSRFFSWSSYWTTRPPLALGSKGAEKSVETACLFAGEDTTSPMSPVSPSCLWVSCAHSPSKVASFDGIKAPYFERKGSKKWAPSSVAGGSYTGVSSVSVASAARATAAKPSARRRAMGQERSHVLAPYWH